MRRRQAHPERERNVGTRWTGALGQPENETIVQRKIYMNHNYTSELYKFRQCLLNHSLQNVATLRGHNQYFDIMCIFDFTMWTQLTKSLGCEEGQHWEWGYAFRKACRCTSSAKKALTLPLAGDQKALLPLIPVHIKPRAEKVKDDSISTLGHFMLWVARCDKLRVWACWCEALSTGSGLTVAAHLTCLRRTWNQGQKAEFLPLKHPPDL